MIASRVESTLARVAHWVASTPEQVAVVDEASRLTYAELARRSDALAAQLREAGAGSDHCIGLFLDRGVNFVIAALAVMKSGAAYLPLDSSTPVKRISSILAGAEAVALVSNAREAARLEPGPWQLIDVEQPPIARATPANVTICPESLAYVIYTSGSTGEPKGVEISHASLRNLIEWHNAAFDVTAADRASQVASLGFDAAVWEIWPYLAAGATVLIADETTRRSAQALHDWILSNNITIGFVPTALAEQLIKMPWPATPRLRTLLTGGDTLRRRPAADLPFRVVNNYGPTECTVVATSATVKPGGGELPSIGRPIANATALVLDESLHAVAHGEVGELCIGGPPVARGYRNRPELTAKHFVDYASPLGELIRVFRTGDRVRMLDNGELAFLGRNDDQVKIRGQRIELGEIVATLNRVEGVETSTVTVRDMADAGPSLVAYVVPATGARLNASKLRSALAMQLPEYMVPAFFVSLDRLPLQVNAKVDVAALPAPTGGNLFPNKTAASNGSQDRGSHIESDGVRGQISAMVASMLGFPSIDPDANFFMIGGHSMLGMELVARIRDTFGVNLSLRQLFSAPTVAALSAEVAQLAKPDR